MVGQKLIEGTHVDKTNILGVCYFCQVAPTLTSEPHLITKKMMGPKLTDGTHMDETDILGPC